MAGEAALSGKYAAYPEYKNSGADWLSEIPVGWLSLSLGKTVKFMNNGSSATQVEENNETVKVTRIETISSGVINLNKIGHVKRSDISSRFFLQKGDIQFSNINSLSMIGNCAIFEVDQELFAGMNLLHIRPESNRVCSRYMVYQFKTKWFRNRVEASAKPAINQASIPTGTLKHFDFLCPPLWEQKIIANFLDHETAKIDTLIEKQQQLIKLLKEKRQAVISHAVTKGLNPNAPMRDSGVEWLGEVPEHWVRIKLKHITKEVIDAEHKTAEYFDDGEYLVCRTTNVRDGQLRLEGGKYTNLETYTEWTRRGVPETGDILFTREAPAGEACVYSGDVPLCLGQRMVLFKLKICRIEPQFVLHSIYSGLSDDFVKQLSQGSTVAHFNMADIQNIPLFEPPMEEQIEINKYLTKVLSKYDGLVNASTDAVSLIQERRTALISAAVTGKIDVRNWQAPEPPTTTSNKNKEVAP